LNIGFGTNNESQVCKASTVCGSYLWELGVNEGDEDEGIKLMGFISSKEIK
jgi:hypothetical protein